MSSSSTPLTRGCIYCKKDKKGCDLKRPCGRCKDRGRSADECFEAPLPPPRSAPKPPTKKRPASAGKRGPAKKRAKKQAKESSDAENEEEGTEIVEESDDEEEVQESGEDGAAGDDQPMEELIWREGDPGLVYDAEVEGGDEEGENESAADGETDAAPEQQATPDEIPFYPVTTYGALANRGFRMPIKTKQSVAALPEEED